MPPTARSTVAGPCAAALLLLLTACGAAGPGAAPGSTPTAGPPPPEAPALDVTVLAEGLDHPWDVAQAPDGTLVVDERAGGFTAVRPDGTVVELEADFGDLFARGETGLMGLVLDPDFADDRRLYSCQGRSTAGGASVAVVVWEVAPDWSAAQRVGEPLVGDIPVNEDSGRHGGCRLRFAPDGALLVGTGDTADGGTPQDLTSLAGKVLRVDPETGAAPPGNPFAGSGRDADERIYTYGHRNVQGLAVRPGTVQVYSVEHGPDVDDEVNLLRPGANFGWDPGAGGYDESVPMTDPDISGAVPAVWSSGDPTIAPSGGTFLDGQQWGSYDGLMLLGVQRDQGVLALRLSEGGELVEQFRLPELEGTYGRIRSVQQGVDGALYVTTDNGADADRLLRVTPRP